jgi:aspartyl/glutamyl-tRNA(Asn/Gln) amidotransferase C subunit
MVLTQEQIKKLANNLSKIAWNNKELSEDLNSNIKYVNLLNEVDTTWVKQTISVVNKKNILRTDELKNKHITSNDLLDCSNQNIIADQISIKNIMN